MLDSERLDRFFRTTEDLDCLGQELEEYISIVKESALDGLFKKNILAVKADLDRVMYDSISNGKFGKLLSKKHLAWIASHLFEYVDGRNTYFMKFRSYKKAKDYLKGEMDKDIVCVSSISTRKGLVYCINGTISELNILVTSHFFDRMQLRLGLSSRKEAIKRFVLALMSSKFLFLNWVNGGSRLLIPDQAKKSIHLGIGHHVEDMVMMTTFISDEMLKEDQVKALADIMLETLTSGFKPSYIVK